MEFKDMRKISLLVSKSSYFLLSLGVMGSLVTTSVYATTEKLKQVVTADQQAYLSTLKDLVNIESGSKDLAGVNQIAKLVAERLKNTGAEVSIIETKDIYRMDDTPAQTGPVVKAVLTGQGKSKIMLIAHMDTVYQKGMLKDQPFRVEGNKAYGLGIVDDKQGVAAIIHVLETLKKINFQDYGTITVLMNSDEEISSPGSRKLITEIGQQQDIVL